MSRNVRSAAVGTMTVVLATVLVALAQDSVHAEPSLRFPWDKSENPWELTQGPHDWTGNSNSGLDFDKSSSPRRVLAMSGGTVSIVPFTLCNESNPILKVSDGSGFEVWYLHMSSFSVSSGQTVAQGQELGYSGDRGCSSAVHVHVELVVNGAHLSWIGRTIDGWTVPNCEGTGCARVLLNSTNPPSIPPTTSPTTTPPSCTQGPDRVVIYEHPDYGGNCHSFGPGDYANPGTFAPVGNDQVSSVRVGSSVLVRLFENENFGGTMLERTGDDNDLHNDGWGDKASSLKVIANCTQGPDRVLIYEHPDYGGNCHSFGPGDYANPGTFAPVGNDQVSSVRVGSSVLVRLFENENFGGTMLERTGDDNDLHNDGWGDKASSLKVIANCTQGPDRVVIYEHPDYGGNCHSFGPGDYANPGTFAPVGNDQVSSVRVGSSVLVRLFENENFGGTMLERTGDDNDLHNDGWGDKASSLRVVEGALLAVNNVSLVESNSGTTAAAFTISRSGATSVVSLVTWATANGSATAGNDYVAVSPTTVSFATGESSKTVTVMVNGDVAGEADETFLVNLSDPVGATIADGSGQGTIVNDDSSFAVNDVTVTEGNSGTKAAAFTVTRSGATGGPASVLWFTSNKTASAPSDYVAVPSTKLDFAVGETTKTVSVTVNGDTAVEANETFYVRLSGPTGATVADSLGIGTITNDDAASFAVNDVTVTEGNSGTKAAAFTVTRSGATGGPASVLWFTSNKTASAPSDYVAVPSTKLDFAVGETTKTVSVTVNGDTAVEANETFYVRLSGPTGATVADSLGIGTITNDDSASFAVNDVTVTEGNSGTKAAAFTVTRSGATGGPASVLWFTSNKTASAPSDYVAVPSTKLDFAVGETTKTVSVTVNGDTAVEANETFYVRLSGPTGATVADSLGIGTITNDDASPSLPGPPVIGTAVASDASAIVNFSPPSSDGGAVITGYRIISSPGSVVVDVGGSPARVSGLQNGTTYTFRVLARNAAGDGPLSAPSNPATPAQLNFGDGRDGEMPGSGNLDQVNGVGFGTLNGTAGASSVTVSDAAAISRVNVGDYVLLHQTRGSNAGVWELNRAASDFTGAGTFSLALPLSHGYLTGGNENRAQIVRVPQYTSCSVTGVVTALGSWNGSWGGILPIMCTSIMTVSGTVSVDGAGFRGGDSGNGYATDQWQGEGILCARDQSDHYCQTPNTTRSVQGGGAADAIGGGGGGGGYTPGVDGDHVGGSTWGQGGAGYGAPDGSTLFFGGGGGGGATSINPGIGYSQSGRGGGIVLLFVTELRVTATGGITANGQQASGVMYDDGTNRRVTAGSGGAGQVYLKVGSADLATDRVVARGGPRLAPPDGGTGRFGGGTGGDGHVFVVRCDSVLGSSVPTFDERQGSC